jgi:hypothetical protein
MVKTEEKEPKFTLRASIPAHLGALVKLENILSSVGDSAGSKKTQHAIREFERWKVMHRQGV